ncbi:hypothetical protein BU23DRAFT_569850 [Bimuria novae-zelandiae CBS 107.79]|uniref:Uncharacterized protein n=1 Tax=Bimuria novae-zelandiae CBS 107.79 TaxID=1447943 RepID=A0A6A5V3K1_9PLEO|nr:hypothetical protein BU23DRAFT_569850 [Bimuria novae-zelandiae CBS 107.79]
MAVYAKILIWHQQHQTPASSPPSMRPDHPYAHARRPTSRPLWAAGLSLGPIKVDYLAGGDADGALLSRQGFLPLCEPRRDAHLTRARLHDICTARLAGLHPFAAPHAAPHADPWQSPNLDGTGAEERNALRRTSTFRNRSTVTRHRPEEGSCFPMPWCGETLASVTRTVPALFLLIPGDKTVPGSYSQPSVCFAWRRYTREASDAAPTLQIRGMCMSRTRTGIGQSILEPRGRLTASEAGRRNIPRRSVRAQVLHELQSSFALSWFLAPKLLACARMHTGRILYRCRSPAVSNWRRYRQARRRQESPELRSMKQLFTQATRTGLASVVYLQLAPRLILTAVCVLPHNGCYTRMAVCLRLNFRPACFTPGLHAVSDQHFVERYNISVSSLAYQSAAIILHSSRFGRSSLNYCLRSSSALLDSSADIATMDESGQNPPHCSTLPSSPVTISHTHILVPGAKIRISTEQQPTTFQATYEDQGVCADSRERLHRPRIMMLLLQITLEMATRPLARRNGPSTLDWSAANSSLAASSYRSLFVAALEAPT